MENQEKKKAPLVLGILSIVFSLLFALVGLILGIIGLVLANNNQNQTKLDYKTEKILNIVGIVVAALNMIYAFMLLSNAGFF